MCENKIIGKLAFVGSVTWQKRHPKKRKKTVRVRVFKSCMT